MARTITIQCAGFLGEPFTIVHDSENQFIRVEHCGNGVYEFHTRLIGDRKPKVAKVACSETKAWEHLGVLLGLTHP